MAPAQRFLDVSQVNDVTVVRLNANMADHIYSQQALKELFSLVDRDRPRKLLLNLGDVEHLPTVALGRFVALDKKLKAHDGQLRLCHLQLTLSEVFAITQVDRSLDIRDDEHLALQGWTGDREGAENKKQKGKGP